MVHEYDAFFGLSISRVDSLPHQLEAVKHHLLKAWRGRFLLADDAGAGKTIMAGLLLKELKLRVLVERVLIICPANLSLQWRRVIQDRFEEDFAVGGCQFPGKENQEAVRSPLSFSSQHTDGLSTEVADPPHLPVDPGHLGHAGPGDSPSLPDRIPGGFSGALHHSAEIMFDY